MVSTGGQYEGDEPEHAYACEIVGCCGLSDGVALFRPVSHDGADLIQIAFLRNEVDDATGAYTERFEAGSFDLPAADLPRSEFGVDLLEYFSGRSFKYTPGVSRGLDPREAVDSIEDAIGCDLGLFDGFWLGVPGEADMRVGPYTKKSLLDFSYYAKELSCRYGFADSDILEIARHLPDECPDCLAAVKAYLDCEYVPDGNAPDEKTYRWGDFLEIAGGDARYAAMLVDRTAAASPKRDFTPRRLSTRTSATARPSCSPGGPSPRRTLTTCPEPSTDSIRSSRTTSTALACSSATGAALPPAPMRTMCPGATSRRSRPGRTRTGWRSCRAPLMPMRACPSPACGTACATGSKASRSAASSSTARKSVSTEVSRGRAASNGHRLRPRLSRGIPPRP